MQARAFLWSATVTLFVMALIMVASVSDAPHLLTAAEQGRLVWSAVLAFAGVVTAGFAVHL